MQDYNELTSELSKLFSQNLDLKNVNNKIGIYISLCFFLSGYSCSNRKDSLTLNFHLKFNAENLELNKNYISTKNDTLQINELRFYISSVAIEFSDKSIYKQENSYHLIDVNVPNSLRIPICKNKKTL